MSNDTIASLSAQYQRLVARGPAIGTTVILAGCGVSFLARHLLLRADVLSQIPSWSATTTAVLGCATSVSAGAIFFLLWERKRAIERTVKVVTEPLEQAGREMADQIIALQTLADRQVQELEVLAGLMENSQGLISVKDAKGRYLAVNCRFANIYRREPKQMVGLSDYDLIHPAEAAKHRSSDMRVITSGLPYELEDVTMLAEEGRTLLVHKFPLRGNQGEVTGVCGSHKTSLTVKGRPPNYAKVVVSWKASWGSYPVWRFAGWGIAR